MGERHFLDLDGLSHYTDQINESIHNAINEYAEELANDPARHIGLADYDTKGIVSIEDGGGLDVSEGSIFVKCGNGLTINEDKDLVVDIRSDLFSGFGLEVNSENEAEPHLVVNPEHFAGEGLGVNEEHLLYVDPETLPKATNETLGVVVPGDGLIADEGLLSLNLGRGLMFGEGEEGRSTLVANMEDFIGFGLEVNSENEAEPHLFVNPEHFAGFGLEVDAENEAEPRLFIKPEHFIGPGLGLYSENENEQHLFVNPVDFSGFGLEVDAKNEAEPHLFVNPEHFAGEGLGVNEEHLLYVNPETLPKATNETFGVVAPGDGLRSDDGMLGVNLGHGLTFGEGEDGRSALMANMDAFVGFGLEVDAENEAEPNLFVNPETFAGEGLGVTEGRQLYVDPEALPKSTDEAFGSASGST